MDEAEYHLDNEAGIRFPPLRPAFSDGDLFFGRFRALVARSTGTSVIGEGGTGRIHLVRDELMDREVALKIPLESILRDMAAREEVIHETRQAMDLTHPNIVRIHDFHEGDRLWGISMQFVRGRNLDEWRFHDTSSTGTRRAIRPYDVDAIRDWIAQLCDALRYAHEDARMVHRDIKPKNLMLEKREGGEKLLLTDFGITQRLRQQTMMLSRDQSRAGEAKGNMGTLPYMPWEQISGGSPSPMDDIYAVGASIYDLVTGRPPFYEGGFEQIKVQIKETVPPSMERRLSDFGLPFDPIPPEWEKVVAACLEKKAENRPQSMREVARALGFQSGSDTRLDAEVKQQTILIRSLQERIEGLTAGGNDQVRALERAEEELAQAKESARKLAAELQTSKRQYEDVQKQLETALKSSATGAVAGAEVQKLQAELDRLKGQLEKAAAADARAKAAEERLAKVAAEQEKALASVRQQAEERVAKVVGEQEKAVATVRQQAENSLRKQTEELEEIRVKAQEQERKNEVLKRLIDDEKDRQAASIRPALLTLLAAVILGSLGGLGYSRMNASKAITWEILQTESAWTEIPKKPANTPSKPVTWGQFKVFAESTGKDPSKLVVKDASKPDDAKPVQGVNWVVAQQFCQWLSTLSGNKVVYRLPTLEELKKTTDRKSFPEWTADWKEPGPSGSEEFLGFYVWFPADEKTKMAEKQNEIPPTMAGKNFGFRVVATNPPSDTP